MHPGVKRAILVRRVHQRGARLILSATRTGEAIAVTGRGTRPVRSHERWTGYTDAVLLEVAVLLLEVVVLLLEAADLLLEKKNFQLPLLMHIVEIARIVFEQSVLSANLLVLFAKLLFLFVNLGKPLEHGPVHLGRPLQSKSVGRHDVGGWLVAG